MTSGTDPFPRETVAVCIPTYNQGQYLARAIHSVLSQNLPVDEIIVSDDGSTDNSAEICEQFAQSTPNFRYVRQSKNLGIEGNSDFVLRQAKSTYVVRLDSDDQLLPIYVRRLLDAIRSAPDAAYAHADIWEIDEKGVRTRLRTLYRTPGFQTSRDALISSLWGYRVAANIILFRRDALVKVDYMKDRGDFAEDYHLSVALARAGYGNVYLAEPLAEYRVWLDQRGVRLRRKERELAGFDHVFATQIEPGFRESGLPVALVSKARKVSALRHVMALLNPHFLPEERARLEVALKRLGDGFRLRLAIFLIRWRLGFLVQAYWFIVDFLRGVAKKWFRFYLRK